jgi:hypothetical protein
MLFTLLTAMTSVVFFTIAVAAAKHAKAGLGGYALAIIIGLSLAIGNAWGLYKMAEILDDLPAILGLNESKGFTVSSSPLSPLFSSKPRIADDLPYSYSETQKEWLGRAFCLLVLLWGLVGAFLTNLVTSAVMRLVA